MRSKTSLIVIAALLVGLGLGYWWASGGQNEPDSESHVYGEETIYTCSMHPQIRQSEPGQCPICGMDLIPVSESEIGGDPMAVSMSETATRLANVQTMKVGSGSAQKSLRLNGTVVPNEKRVKTQSAHVEGRVEQLLVNTTGERVASGQLVARIYSPELVTAQRELLQAYNIREEQPALYKAARQKLHSLKISEAQINRIVKSGEVQENIGLYADQSGVVLEKKVQVGDYLERGEALYTVADLSSVWVNFEAYESELGFLKEGQQIDFTVASIPGEQFEGKITFIDPVVDAQTRVADVRVETKNPDRRLKPQMYASAEVRANIGDGSKLVVPKSAVMWTGERSVVYVKKSDDPPSYRLHNVILGPSLGSGYVIESGLEQGEEVVTNGAFTVDAAAQLAGKPSMMNPSFGSEIDSAAKAEINPEVRATVRQVIQSYFVLKDALVNAEGKSAARSADKTLQLIKQVPMEKMAPQDHNIWMSKKVLLEEQLGRISALKSVDAQREEFIGVSENMVELARHFGPFEKAVYILNCPMTDDYEGADWLSSSDEVLNPYYGEKMLRCGSVKSVIE